MEVLETVDNKDLYALMPGLGERVKALWNDPGMQAAYERSNEFQLQDSAK